ncbi:MAG: efflux RND transporter periplasmic adaptor subunit [bacterium]
MSYKNFTPAIFLLWILFLSANCGDDSEAQNGGTNGITEKVTDVKVMLITPQSFSEFIEVTGTVRADIAAVISAEESGVIEAFLKDKGELVSEKEVVVQLKSKVLQASFNEAKAAYLLSKATFDRQANLYRDKVISEQKYLEYKYSLDRDHARYENLQARLEKTRIKSPVAGVIDNRLVEVGEFVLPGTPLFKVVKTDVVKIAAAVPERYITDVQIGSPVTISFDILQSTELQGKVFFVGPSIDKSSRTFPIEIAIKNRKRQLKPEMYANIKIKKAQLENVVVIPRDAIIETETGKYVFVDKGNLAVKRQVRIGGSYNNQIWITEGLAGGERLIVVGHRDLVDGERIAVHE